MHKSRNRKTVTYDGWIVYNDEKLEICNSQKYGVYKEIVLAFIEQLDLAMAIHKRVLVLRLDFHMNQYTEDNKTFSNFVKNVRQYLDRKLNIQNVGYQWVREHERSKKQHYHLALILDGNKIQYPSKLIKTIQEKWLPRGSIWKPKKCFYYIDKHNTSKVRGEAIFRASYMAKIRGKQYRPAQTKDYYCSRLKSKAS